MALESKWADAPEEPPKSKPQRNSPRKSHSDNNREEAPSSSSSNRSRRRGGRGRGKGDSSPVREPVSFDAYRSKPLSETRSPVREPINFDRYREKPINGRQTPDSSSGSNSGNSHGSRSRGGRRRSSASRNGESKPAFAGNKKGNASNTPPISRGKPDLQHKSSSKPKEPESSSKLELLKKKIAEQQSILKVTKHKEEQKQLLDDFLNGDDEINWEDDE